MLVRVVIINKPVLGGVARMAKWTQADFIRAWIEATKMEDVIKTLGESEKSETRLRQFASELRKAGIPLPQFRGKTKEAVAIDPQAGIALLAQLQNKSESEVRRLGKEVQQKVGEKADRVRKATKKRGK